MRIQVPIWDLFSLKLALPIFYIIMLKAHLKKFGDSWSEGHNSWPKFKVFCIFLFFFPYSSGPNPPHCSQVLQQFKCSLNLSGDFWAIVSLQKKVQSREPLSIFWLKEFLAFGPELSLAQEEKMGGFSSLHAWEFIFPEVERKSNIWGREY